MHFACIPATGQQGSKRSQTEITLRSDGRIASTSSEVHIAATHPASTHPSPASGHVQRSILQRMWDESVAVLLPANFPKSVTENYLPYCKWQAVHSVSGSAMLVLSMQSLVPTAE